MPCLRSCVSSTASLLIACEDGESTSPDEHLVGGQLSGAAPYRYAHWRQVTGVSDADLHAAWPALPSQRFLARRPVISSDDVAGLSTSMVRATERRDRSSTGSPVYLSGSSCLHLYNPGFFFPD